MDSTVYVIIVVLVAVGIITAFLALRRRKEGRPQEPDYRVFFILGICFTGMGTVFMTSISLAFIGITGMGIAYMMIGLANRDKWKKK
jgi:hypothetical protein